MADLVERAYAAAASGQCMTAAQIEKVLRKEGFLLRIVEEHLSGPTLRKELVEICRKATQQDLE